MNVFLRFLLRFPKTVAIFVILLAVLAGNFLYLTKTTSDPLYQWSGLTIAQKEGFGDDPATPEIEHEPIAAMEEKLLAKEVYSDGHEVEGFNTVDPNDGFTTQALGVQSARQILSGKLPFWNHYEGLGSPLLGEMQSGALFLPFNLLLLLPNGFLWFHLLLEFLAGIGMFLFLRKFIRTLGAVDGSDSEQLRHLVLTTVGGILFALNGSFAFIHNAAFNPVAFLPWILLGVEYARAAACKNKFGGAALIAIPLAYSLYAGFPEVAYLNGVFVALWIVLRWPRPTLFSFKFSALWSDLRAPAMRKYIASIFKGGIVALLLAAPFLAASLETLRNSTTGNHEGAGPGQLMVLGTDHSIDSSRLLTPFGAGVLQVTNVGGYITLSLLVLAILAFWNSRLPRKMAIATATYSVLAIVAIWDLAPFKNFWLLLPGHWVFALNRYIQPSLSLAVIILAIFGLDFLVQKVAPPRKPAASKLDLDESSDLDFDLDLDNFTPIQKEAEPKYLSTRTWPALRAIAGAGLILSILTAISHSSSDLFRMHPSFVVIEAGVSLLSLAGIAVAAFLKPLPAPAADVHNKDLKKPVSRLIVQIILIGFVVAESVALFNIPALSAPRKYQQIDTSAVQFLQENLGNQRFYSTCGFSPNYGSYFDISELNVNDLPVPSDFAAFEEKLNPKVTDPILFDAGGTPDIDRQMLTHLEAYKSVGVKYIFTCARQGTRFSYKTAGLEKVFADQAYEIWQVPDYEPYVKLENGLEGDEAAKNVCWLNIISRDSFKTTCSVDSKLVRSELVYPGWKAYLDGNSEVEIGSNSDGTLQTINVPAGEHTVEFKYVPAHFGIATISFFVGILAWIAIIIFNLINNSASNKFVKSKPTDNVLSRLKSAGNSSGRRS